MRRPSSRGMGINFYRLYGGRIVLMGMGLLLAGCQPATAPDSESTPHVPSAPALPADAVAKVRGELLKRNPGLTAEQIVLQAEDGQIVAAEIRDAGLLDLTALTGLPLQILGLAGNPVRDLTPLRGMPLRELDLERTAVQDLAPLSEAPLEQLWLNQTAVRDLSPLRRARLRQLSLLGTPVVDLSPLKGQPLEQLWLNETKISDLSPLAGAPLISLTLHRTPIADLQILRTMPSLQRLHVGESAVSDLRPLKGLRLRRLIVTPARIQHGWEVLRQMDTLTELDVEFRESGLLAPAEFWRRYEQGEWQK